MIVLRSNIKINSYLENYADKVGHHIYPFLRITDSIETRVIIGLIFFRGLLGLHKKKNTKRKRKCVGGGPIFSICSV